MKDMLYTFAICAAFIVAMFFYAPAPPHVPEQARFAIVPGCGIVTEEVKRCVTDMDCHIAAINAGWPNKPECRP